MTGTKMLDSYSVELDKFILGEQDRIRKSLLPEVIKIWDKEGEGSFPHFVQRVINIMFNDYASMN
jgi:hypothetical protein